MQAKIAKINGSRRIIIDGQPHNPLSFRSFRPTAHNISTFYGAGVRLMSVLASGLPCSLDVPYSPFGDLWVGPGEYDFGALDDQMRLFIDNAPDAYLLLMFQLDTRPWWRELNPGISDSYHDLVDVAGHATWRQEAAAFAQAVISYTELRYGERVFGYGLFCGRTTEWYTGGITKPEQQTDNPPKEQAYRAWLGDPQASLPTLAALRHTSDGVFRHPIEDRAALDYWRFHNDLIGDTALYFADSVQQVIHHNKLLGLFYGYLIELCGTRLLQEGQLGYERVWASPDIDMIFAPASYGHIRDFEGSSGFLGTVDSIDLHNKLYWHEIDHRTHTAVGEIEGHPIPGSNTRLGDAKQSIAVLRREYAMSTVKRAGTWWFDMFGGWFDDPDVMADIAQTIQIDARIRQHTLSSVSQVAVFGDVESMYYVADDARLNDDLLHHQRRELNRMGVPYDLYTLSDIYDSRLPHRRYKLYIFLNAFRADDRFRAWVRENIHQQGKTALWLYAPGYIAEDDLSVDSMSDLIGMQLGRLRREGRGIRVLPTDILSTLSPGTSYGFQGDISPTFYIADRKATVLGTYEQGGSALGYKVDYHTAFYSGAGPLPHQILREIARYAGAHVYSETSDPVYVNNRLIGVHSQQGNEIILTVPHSVNVEDLYDGDTYRSQDQQLVLPTVAGEMKIYLVLGNELVVD